MQILTSSKFRHTLLKFAAACLLSTLLLFAFTHATLAEEPEGDGELEASTVHMTDGGTYDISTYSGATWLNCSTSGTFTIKGTSQRTLLVINAEEGRDITIIFDNVRLVATQHCPGAAANARSAIEINGSGGTVTLCSAAGSTNYFRGKGGRPCIRKDGTGVKLIFSTADPANPGLMEVHADPNAHNTTAIGCYSTTAIHRTFGNCVFESGRIEAYGSSGDSNNLYGGAAIGADKGGAVDGITFENADVYAEAGSASAAGIGTSSCYIIPITQFDRAPYPCSNITINGGTIKATHKSGSEGSLVYGGAGIGGGWGGSCDHLTINGGYVEAYGSLNAAGIGGGQDGDATDFIINGGTIIAQGGAAGIGSGSASGSVCSSDELRYGDCQLTINGGDITATGGITFSGEKTIGVGIGGWKEKFFHMSSKVAGRMNITITGGTIRAQGNSAAAIGSGEYGNCQNINISGGVITVHTSNFPVDIGGCKTTTSTCENITITGGTVLNSDKNAYVIIGGNNPGSWGAVTDTTRTKVYISGGNVRGKIYDSDHALVSSANDTPVYLYELGLADFGLSPQRSNDRVAVTSIAALPEPNFAYGLNDTYLATSSITADPVMNAWLPNGVGNCSLETDPAFLDRTYDLRPEDVNFFTGNVPAERKGTLYPRLWFLFDDNYIEGDLTRESASYFIGRKKAESISNEEIGGLVPEYYSLDEDGRTPLLKPDGTFYANVSDPAKGTAWTDSAGKLIVDPGVNQNYYLDGICLYASWASYNLEFQGNKPAGTAMPLSGSTESIQDIDPKTGTTLPECGFGLKNYTFAGWNTVSDGSGQMYQPGATLTQVRPISGRTSYLYAIWEPDNYSVNYDPGDGDGSLTSIDYVFDKSDCLAYPDDLGFGRNGFALAGWTTSALGSLYDAGEDFVNMCDIDGDGNLSERTLTALWIPEQSVAVTLTLDGERLEIEDPEQAIKLVQDETVFTGFTEDLYSGAYVLAADVRGSLPPGTYSLTIDGYDTGDTSFEIDETSTVSLILDFYTVTIAAADHITASCIYDPAGAEVQTIQVRDESTIEIASEAANGYVFDIYGVGGVEPGWEYGPETACQNITVHGKADLTAFARAGTYFILFDANGGTGFMANEPAVYDMEVSLFDCGFTRTGYEFTGWNTANDGSGDSFADSATVSNLTAENEGTVTLYAMWAVVPYSISYNLNGGKLPEGKSNPETYTIEDEITLAAPVRDGYTFAGWSGTDVPQPVTALVIPKGSYGDRSYAANWNRIRHSVVFNMGGHGNAPSDQSVEEGSCAVRPADPAATGWTFTGWYADSALTTKFDFDAPIYGDTTVFAGWKKNDNPNTGDKNNLYLWLIILAAACTTLAAALKSK